MGYKIGDRVVCVNDIGTPFINGQILIVTNSYQGFLSFGHDSYRWGFTRFKLHEINLPVLKETFIIQEHYEL